MRGQVERRRKLRQDSSRGCRSRRRSARARDGRASTAPGTACAPSSAADDRAACTGSVAGGADLAPGLSAAYASQRRDAARQPRRSGPPASGLPRDIVALASVAQSSRKRASSTARARAIHLGALLRFIFACQSAKGMPRSGLAKDCGRRRRTGAARRRDSALRAAPADTASDRRAASCWRHTSMIRRVAVARTLQRSCRRRPPHAPAVQAAPTRAAPTTRTRRLWSWTNDQVTCGTRRLPSVQEDTRS